MQVSPGGGFVCDQTTAVVPPVQNGERIVFAIRDGPPGRRTTATVQISYTGQVDSFAWVVPLASVPDSIEVASPALFDALDRATQPTFIEPGGEAVYDDGYDATSSSGGCGTGGGGSGPAAGSPPPRLLRAERHRVTVFGRERVGPYDTVVVGTETPQPSACGCSRTATTSAAQGDSLIASTSGSAPPSSR